MIYRNAINRYEKSHGINFMETTAQKQNVTYLHQDIEWTTPLEKIIPETSEKKSPYPIDALPSLIQNAVFSYHQYGQQPLPLIACSALSNLSLACQTLGNVARDKYLVSPVSLYFLSIANSGERKSAVDQTFSKAIRQWQIKMREKLGAEIKVAEAIHKAWAAEKEGLLSQIRKNAFGSENTTMLQVALMQHVSNEPQIPLQPVLFFEDATQEALASHIASGWPSASLWSDEGALIIGGHGMQGNATKFIALLNRLWDGNPFIAHRKTSKSFTVSNRRLTISLMMQPIILEQMLSKSGGISRQSGFLARTLIAYPESEMGNRFYQEPKDMLTSLSSFHNRLTDCLQKTVDLDKHGCHDLPTLELSPAAKTKWISFFNKVESGLKNVNEWQSIKDFASKSAENAARLAALFHLFDDRQGDISSETMDQAIEIISWHMNEAKRVLGQNIEAPVHLDKKDANALFHWIIEKGLYETSPRELQQLGPVRDKKRRDTALAILCNEGYLKESKRDGKTMLLVNPCFSK